MSGSYIQSRAKPIAVYENVSRDIFEARIKPSGQPAILRGLVSDWDCVKAGQKGGAEFAAMITAQAQNNPVKIYEAAPEHKGRFLYTDDLSAFNFENYDLPLHEVIARLRDEESRDNIPAFYAGSMRLAEHLPALEGAIPLPLLDKDTEQLKSLWLGGRTVVPPHYDLPQNIACVVYGQRRFTLFPMDQISNLYIGPIDFTPAGQACSLVNMNDPDLQKHPKFEAASAHAQSATLVPGDAIYIPSMWWHQVESLTGFGALINFWWRDGPDYLASPKFTLLHALTTLRDMPPGERAAWKTVFEHYIFDDPDGAVEHMPEPARRVLGPMTPQRVSNLRQYLGNMLLPKRR